MKQREIWMAELNPVRGSEQQGIRPVVIISGNAMNDHLGICIVCPLTTQIKHYAGCLVVRSSVSNGLAKDSEIITFQIRTIAGERLLQRIGEISIRELDQIKSGLKDILTY